MNERACLRVHGLVLFALFSFQLPLFFCSLCTSRPVSPVNSVVSAREISPAPSGGYQGGECVVLQCAPTPPLACAHARLTNPRGASGRPRGQELSRALCDSHAPRETSRGVRDIALSRGSRGRRAARPQREKKSARGAQASRLEAQTRDRPWGSWASASALDQPRSASGPFPRRIMGVRGVQERPLIPATEHVPAHR